MNRTDLKAGNCYRNVGGDINISIIHIDYERDYLNYKGVKRHNNENYVSVYNGIDRFCKSFEPAPKFKPPKKYLEIETNNWPADFHGLYEYEGRYEEEKPGTYYSYRRIEPHPVKELILTKADLSRETQLDEIPLRKKYCIDGRTCFKDDLGNDSLLHFNNGIIYRFSAKNDFGSSGGSAGGSTLTWFQLLESGMKIHGILIKNYFEE